MFYYIMLHLSETFSATSRLSSHLPAITATFLLCTAALICIYFQTKTNGKVSIPARRLGVMAGIKVPPIPPSNGRVKVTGLQSLPKSAATSLQWLVIATDPVCSIKMSGPRPGRKAEVRAGRSGGGLIVVHHCPLHLEECHLACLWHFAYQPCVA